MAKESYKVERMKLDDLNPAVYNPRKISVEAFNGLGKSLDRFGMLVPIVWNKRTGNIVGGHQRYKQLKERGETETDVVVVDMNDTDEVALNIALNSKAIRGDFTIDAIKELEKAQVQMGSKFNDVLLNDLLRDMHYKFRKELQDQSNDQKPKDKRPRDEKKDTGIVAPKPKDIVSNSSNEPDAVITCRCCRSKWKLKDNTITFNSKIDKKD